jgi:hypothetical protein
MRLFVLILGRLEVSVKKYINLPYFNTLKNNEINSQFIIMSQMLNDKINHFFDDWWYWLGIVMMLFIIFGSSSLFDTQQLLYELPFVLVSIKKYSIFRADSI